MKVATLLVSIGLTLPFTAQADYICSGAVKNLMVSPNGTVTTSIGTLTSVYLCSLSTTYNGVAPEVCRAIHAQLLAATVAGRDVRVYRHDSAGCSAATPCCSQNWTSLSNWYAGPEFVQ